MGGHSRRPCPGKRRREDGHAVGGDLEIVVSGPVPLTVRIARWVPSPTSVPSASDR